MQRETRNRSPKPATPFLGAWGTAWWLVGRSATVVKTRCLQRARAALCKRYTQSVLCCSGEPCALVFVSVTATALMNSPWKQKALILHARADRRRAQGCRFFSCGCSLHSHGEPRRAGRNQMFGRSRDGFNRHHAGLLARLCARTPLGHARTGPTPLCLAL